MTTQTQTQVCEEPPYIRINPVTGHAMNIDDDTTENIRRALGSDHADPPNAPQNMSIPRWQFHIPGNANQQPFHPPSQPLPRHPVGGGGGNGGGSGGDGGGGGGDGGGGLPVPHGDQACSHHMDELLTLTNSSVANLSHSQETGRKSNPSSRNGNYTVELTPTTQPCKTNTRRQCYSSPTSRET
jgi:hypothetical protein